MAQAGRTFVGLDIGTTKISCVVADMNGGELRVVGEAERMAGIPVRGVYAGIAGDHIRSINSRGVIAVSRKDNEIGAADVERVVEAAKAVAIPMDREIIHVIPQEFIV